jgi:2,4-dienoyl-CoA reductase-like NADH-dependent reductase (Old Yellow Enzyme family)
MSNDPLLQPFKLKHLTLRNRIIVTSHEPAYPEDGMPKGRYRTYTVERARGGVAMTMTAGSAAVAKDSPAHSSRPPHALGQGRLAACRGTIA